MGVERLAMGSTRLFNNRPGGPNMSRTAKERERIARRDAYKKVLRYRAHMATPEGRAERGVIAVHEAGHGVVAAYIGLPFNFLSSVPEIIDGKFHFGAQHFDDAREARREDVAI